MNILGKKIVFADTYFTLHVSLHQNYSALTPACFTTLPHSA